MQAHARGKSEANCIAAQAAKADPNSHITAFKHIKPELAWSIW